jgi:hypothetical protein
VSGRFVFNQQHYFVHYPQIPLLQFDPIVIEAKLVPNYPQKWSEQALVYLKLKVSNGTIFTY